jgi:AraC-like DNA-binding protein
VAEVSMPAGLHLPRHAHGSGQLVFVLEGSYRERWMSRKGERIDLRPGSVLYRPPAEPHANVFGDEDVLALTVSYHPDRLAGLPGRRPVTLPSLLVDLQRRIATELRAHHRGDAASSTALEGLALLLLARLERSAGSGEPAGRPDWLGDAVRFVERRHAEPISLASVAAAVGRHRTTVAAAFRRHLGRSVGEVLRDVRLGRAIEEIRSTDRPLAEIALVCGFYDQAHMGRLLKRATGRTPGAIRRRGPASPYGK